MNVNGESKQERLSTVVITAVHRVKSLANSADWKDAPVDSGAKVKAIYS
jgi:hypothetical protein